MVATKAMENFSFRLLLTCGELSLGYIMTIDKSVCLSMIMTQLSGSTSATTACTWGKQCRIFCHYISHTHVCVVIYSSTAILLIINAHCARLILLYDHYVTLNVSILGNCKLSVN